MIGTVLRFEAAFLALPCIVALIYREKEGWAYFAVALLCLGLGQLLVRREVKSLIYYAKQGFIMVALNWVVLSLFGALPFVLCGDIPSYVDALFETVSGLTTTGSSILTDVEALSHTSLFWRSFTHWIGGMGVFVLMLAVLPTSGAYNMNLMKAESPGPQVSKLVPRLRDTAVILYGIYFALTVVEIVILLISGMPLFDSLTLSFGTAGTGGFGIKNDSIASYTAFQQMAIAVFMVLFGVNFNAYYFLLGKDKKAAFKMEEVRWYFCIILISVLLICISVFHMYDGLGETFRHAFFQVASIITTTGYATTDFNLWPMFPKLILVTIMFIGACAGSTGGGIKVSRIIIMVKSVMREIGSFIHPRSVQSVKIDGKGLTTEVRRSAKQYFLTFILVFIVSMLIISWDSQDFEVCFTSVAATINNIGPGLGKVGPTGNFADFTILSKLVFIFDMLAGRLELYPMLLLIAPYAWRSYNK